MAARRDKAKDVRTARSNRLETDFGEPIRDDLRAFSKSLMTLRVFTLPAATEPAQRMEELTNYRGDWDKAATAIEMLLREADASPGVEATHWGDTWQENIRQADAALQELIDVDNPTDDDIRAKAKEALAHYGNAVAHARYGLDTEREKLAPLPPASISGWLLSFFRNNSYRARD